MLGGLGICVLFQKGFLDNGANENPPYIDTDTKICIPAQIEAKATQIQAKAKARGGAHRYENRL